MIGTNADITERRLAEEKEAVRMRREASVGRIAAAVAHEVNNPLGTIKFLLRALTKQTTLGPARRDLGILEEQVNRIATTIRALLGFSRLRSDTAEGRPAAEVIGSVLDLFRGGLEARGIRFQAMLGPNLPIVYGDYAAFQEVVINLLENAREILPSGRTVTLEAWVEGGVFVLRVRDDGPGLGADPDRLFRPFITNRRGGTGLGLAISRGICETSGGTLAGENAPEGGAIFTMKLPCRFVGDELRIDILASRLEERGA